MTAEATLATGERPIGRRDRFLISQGTELTDSGLVSLARETHARGYIDMGFVRTGYQALDGSLPADIDKARGENVDYYLAVDTSHGTVEDPRLATVRKINIPRGGSIDDLPAYGLCKNSLSSTMTEFLSDMVDQDIKVKEIAALAKSPNTSPLAIFEVLRDPFQDSLGKGEVWFFSIVSTTYDALQDNFGPHAIVKVGDPVTFDDERINPDLSLVPAVVMVDSFLDGISKAAIEETDVKHQHVLTRSFMFFSEGIPDDLLSDDSVKFRNFVNEMITQKDNVG